jgi:hypothetical protein
MPFFYGGLIVIFKYKLGLKSILVYSLTLCAFQLHAKEFKVFDSTLYTNKPSLDKYGVEPLYVAYEQFLFKEYRREKRDKNTLPDPENIKKQIANASKLNDIMVVDIECWSVHDYDKYPAIISNNIKNLYNSTLLIKSISGDTKIGLFGVLPITSGGAYSKQIAPVGSREDILLADNNQMLQPLANIVDVVFPVAYAFNRNISQWKMAINKQVDTARKLAPDKPVYIFLWPQYADYPPTPKTLYKKNIDQVFWRYQLDESYRIADGVVIWGGWGNEKREKWNSNNLWWITLKKFMIDIKK